MNGRRLAFMLCNTDNKETADVKTRVFSKETLLGQPYRRELNMHETSKFSVKATRGRLEKRFEMKIWHQEHKGRWGRAELPSSDSLGNARLRRHEGSPPKKLQWRTSPYIADPMMARMGNDGVVPSSRPKGCRHHVTATIYHHWQPLSHADRFFV